MTPKASPYNSRGFEQGENLRIKVNRLFDSERVALHYVRALFQSAYYMHNWIPQVLRTRGYYAATLPASHFPE